MKVVLVYLLAPLVASAQDSVPPTDPLGSDDVCMASDGPGCTPQLLQKKAAGSVHLSPSSEEKVDGVLSFRPDNILPKSTSKQDLENAPVPPGTKDNMDPFPVDLSGVWWISWDGQSPIWFPEKVYDWLGVEVGWTFAGMTSNRSGEPWFPAKLRAPTGLKRHWMYTDRLGSRFGMYFKAHSNPEGTLGLTFFNDTYAEIGTGSSYCPSALLPESLHWMIPPKYRGDMKWLFIKIDDDTWLRPTICGEASMATYTLKRIIYENGKPNHKYWKPFLHQFEYPAAWHLRNYGSDDTCERKCCASRTLLWGWLPEWTGYLRNCKACVDSCKSEQ